MKKLLAAALLPALVFAVSPAFAERDESPPQSQSAAPDAQSSDADTPEEGEDRGADAQQRFEQRKAEMVRRISGHIAEMQKARGCVEAATKPEDLRDCRPPRRDGGPDGDRGPEDGGGPREGGPDDDSGR